MSKRKLNRRQSWRIERKQQERSARAKRSDAMGDEALQGGALGDEQHGRVIARYGSQADIEDGAAVVHRCHLRANLGSLVAGDNVVFCAGDGTGVVVARDARYSELRRPDKFGNVRTVAANIDRVIITIAALPEPHSNLIDRYLVATENLGAEAVILLNKSDLLADHTLRENLTTILEPYGPLGYTIVHSAAALVGCVKGQGGDTREGQGESKSVGLSQIATLLKDHTSILVGQSGVGKTTLVNALLPEAAQRVGALSPEKQKGRHTTTTARLFPLAGGGALIDSPGIREFGLWHMTRGEVERGFPEFRELLGRCRFRDCKHDQEPGCALADALEAGRIHPARLRSFRHIVASLEMPLQG